jgi:hypothetical protein
MNFQTIAHDVYPFWILGVLVMGAVVLAGRKNLLRAQGTPLIKWLFFLLITTLYRIGAHKLFPHFHGVGDTEQVAMLLPWTVTLTVFWEDACHGLPLLILKELLGVNKLAKPIYYLAMLLTMMSFSLGHMYQGILPAIILSFYIGTMMICHILYDLVTLLFAQYIFGM